MVTEISSLSDLDDMRNNLSEDYVLTSDIDASDTQNWTNGFNSIGERIYDNEKGEYVLDNAFTGSLDGQGYTIYNLYSSGTYAGLFEYAGNVEIKNITFDSVEFKMTGDGLAGMCCTVRGCTFNNVSVNGNIFNSYVETYGVGSAGFLSGKVNTDDIIIKNCSVDGFIGKENPDYTKFSYSGGMVGANFPNDIYIVNCNANVDISGNECGGLIGYGFKMTIEDCDVTGTIGPVSSMSGGLVGRMYGEGDSLIENCTFSGVFTQTGGYCGGISGYYGNGVVKNCEVDFTVENANDWVFGVGYTFSVENTDVKMDVNGGTTVIGVCNYGSDEHGSIIKKCNVDINISDVSEVYGFCNADFDVLDSHITLDINSSGYVYPFSFSASSFERCSATGYIETDYLFLTDYLGTGNVVKDCYFEAEVYGQDPDGGIFVGGSNSGVDKVDNFYVSCDINGSFGEIYPVTQYNDNGYSDDSIYYDEERMGVSDDNFVGLTTDEMTGEVTKDNMDELNFRTTWATTGSYPILSNQVQYLSVDDVFIDGQNAVVAGGEYDGY